MHPCSFREFLYATENDQMVEMLGKTEVPGFLHPQLTTWFKKYATFAGKEFTLLCLPYYLVHRLERELDKIFDSAKAGASDHMKPEVIL